MNDRYAPLFTPFTLNNGITIKNRLAVAPMTHFGANPDGSLGEEEARFIEGRAADFGLFITAATLVAENGKTFPGQPHAIGQENLPRLTALAERIKKQNAKAILQIHHGGARAADFGLIKHPLAPSAINQAKALEDSEIHAIINAFGQATELALQAGFDGIEIHGANDYLLQQFYSAKTNRRTDQWGGSPENRMRFPLAVIDAAVAAKQRHQRDDFIIGYRFSPEEAGEDGLTMHDTLQLIDRLLDKPLQYLHVSLWDFYKKARRGADTNQSRMQLIHERIGGKLPLIGVGNLFTADDLIAAYQTGWAEFLAVGKASLINPNFATLIKTGKEEQIQTAIDPERKTAYRYPEALWQQQLQGPSWLPPLKGADWQPRDV
ncbi:NADH-dependent flavin oxidoreductase [Avibacterium sp. 20-15]|uniref:NADH-dependent flavin oxidoreductase n=1 Tax=unclassified Avibacterium TaxID=2685287 RepID=UPI002025DF67|nr:MULTISPECIES: NADH-dependent flavin oxidoreductase [unclassified Avibacterium]MCW9733012.1 NADH-dependent flavin oxidoreductase [Avibacterium sp. 20-15]URL05142.1 NADH-dependent flavin oxidoreductase [Avibacterium sp. 20-132]